MADPKDPRDMDIDDLITDEPVEGSVEMGDGQDDAEETTTTTTTTTETEPAAEDDALPDELLFDDERAKYAADEFIDDDTQQLLSELAELERDSSFSDNPKFAKFVAANRAALTRIPDVAARERNIVAVVRTLQSELEEFGMSAEDLQDRNWTQKLKAKLRASAVPEKATVTKTDAPIEDYDDDGLMTGAAAKKLVAESTEPLRRSVEAMTRERADSHNETLVKRAFDYHWDKNPLLRELAKDKELGPLLKERAYRSLTVGGARSYAALLGRDGSGTVIAEALQEHAELNKMSIRAAQRVFSKSKEDADKGEAPGRRKVSALKSGTTPLSKTKKMAVPSMVENVGGRSFKRPLEDRLDEFRDGFGSQDFA